MDGVLYDFSGAVRAWLLESGARTEEQLVDTAGRWAFYEAWGFTRGEYETHVGEGIRARRIFRRGEPEPGTREALQGLLDADYNVHLITARGAESVGQGYGVPELCQEHTMAWLDDWDLPYTSLTFSRDKTTVATGYFLEDNVANYERLRADGSFAVLLDRPWNQDMYSLDGSLVVRDRVKSVQDFTDRVVWGARRPEWTQDEHLAPLVVPAR